MNREDHFGGSAKDEVRRLLLAVVLGAAIDLTFSAANGYPLVRPLWSFPPSLWRVLVVIGIELILVFPIVAIGYLAIRAATGLPRIGAALSRAPRTPVLGAAVLPVILSRLYRGTASAQLLVALGLAGLVGVLFALELARFLPRPRRMEGRLAALLGVVLLPAAVSLPSLTGPPVEFEADRPGVNAEEGPSLLVIVLDTLRADHLGSYGYPRSTSLWLDDFARSSVVFERAVAPSSYTLPSHATLFTGLYPRAHGAHVVGSGVSLSQLGLADDGTTVQPLSRNALTLAEIARDAGLTTGAVCANVAYLSPYFALDQGFETYAVPGGGWYAWQPAGLVLGRKLLEQLGSAEWNHWYHSRILSSGRYYLLASEVNELALRWLEPRRDSRFFLFLNYMDAHAPYLPVDGYREAFPFADAAQIVDRAAIESGHRGILPDERRALVDAYDAEIKYLDDQLASLFRRLEDWGVLDDTVVVIVGDHGESFGEHNEMEHATGLHEPQIHVPLLIRVPGQTTGRREPRLVHLAEVMPTLIDLLGLEMPSDLQATSLFESESPFPIVAHLGPYGREYTEDAIYSDPWKLIVSSRGDIELYDVRADPDETVDLSVERADVTDELIRQLEQFKVDVTPRFGLSSEGMDPETIERLKALGYIR